MSAPRPEPGPPTCDEPGHGGSPYRGRGARGRRLSVALLGAAVAGIVVAVATAAALHDPGAEAAPPARTLPGAASTSTAGATVAAAMPAPQAEPSAEPRFETVGAKAIPRGVVAALAQDRDGFLWVATGDGLVRYDGHGFKPQEREDAPPLARNLGWVQAMLPARDGRLWLGTEAGSLAAYDPASGRIDVHAGVQASDGDLPGAPVSPPSIAALAEDVDGAIWVGGLGSGLIFYDPQRRLARRVTSGLADGLPDQRVQALRVDRDGHLWVGSRAGLSLRRAGSTHFEPVAGLAGQLVQRLFQAGDGRLWAGTAQGEVALVGSDGTARAIPAPPDGRPRGAVTAFVQQPDGAVWVGHASGIDLVEPVEGRTLRRLRHDPRQPAGLAADEISSLLLDRAGWVWVGGLGGGLQRHNPGNRSLVLHRLAGSGEQAPVNDFRSVLALDNGEVWAASHAAGITVFDAQFGVGSGLGWPPPAGAASPDVGAMVQSRDGTVWLGSEDRLHRLGRDRRPIGSLSHGGGRTHRLLAGSDGSLWAATQEGLFRIGPGAAAATRVGLAGGEPLAGEIYALAEADDGSLWVGGATGLHHLPAGGDALQPVSSPPGQGIGGPAVIGLLVDRSGTLWLDAAIAGLHRLASWDGRQARFDRISERHGLVGRLFGANLLEDGRGRIWTHMHLYDPATDRLHELSAADGADLGTGWFRSYAKAADGRLLFGGSKGLLAVHAESFEPAAQAPPLVVSELRVDGRRRPAGAAPPELRLEPGTRSFSLDFAALDYGDPRRIRYAWRLQGFEAQWTRADAELRTVSYSNLAPGDYLLQARASHRSGAWESAELQIPLRVLPHWWETGWARLALLPLLAGLLAALVHLRTRLLHRRQLELEGKVRQRTRELEAMAEALQEKSAELEASSLSDPLTGLHNRRFLAAHIEHDIAAAVRRHEGHALHGAPLPEDADIAFFLLDIDHFKQVNDRHGHAAGDAVLMQMRGRLLQVFRAGDYLVRWGGEEFLIVTLGTSRKHVSELAERARAAVAEQPFEIEGGTAVPLSCSIGFACFPPAPRWPRALEWLAVVKLADAALYLVKRGGRNGWLGLLRAEAESEEALRKAAAQPLAEWRASGALQMSGRLLGAANGGEPAAAVAP